MTFLGEVVLIHCGKFRPNDIWFLDDNDLFEQRELRLGTCPQCGKEVGELCERRKLDGKLFYERVSGRKLDWLKKKEQNFITYTAQDCNRYRFKKKVQGGCMGLIQQ